MLSVQLYKHALTDAGWNVDGKEHAKLEELGSHKSSAETAELLAVQCACVSTQQRMNVF